MAPNEKIHFGKNAFEQWAELLLYDEYFINEDMLAGPLDTYGSCVFFAGAKMHYILEYLNRALGDFPDMQIMLEGLSRHIKKKMRYFRDLLNGVISLMQTESFFKQRFPC